MIKRILGAALVAAAFAPSAWAATHTVDITADYGLLDDLGVDGYTSDTFKYLSGQSFDDVFTFTVGGTASIVLDLASVTNLPYKGLVFDSITLTRGSSATLLPIGGSFPSYLLGELSEGKFTLTLTGHAVGTGGGSYHLDLYTGAVPEPTSVALLLAGAGVAGVAAIRRRRHT